MGLFNKSAAKKEFKPFKCPYCFEEINHNEVHFLIKAATGFKVLTDIEKSFLPPDEREKYDRDEVMIKPYLPRQVDGELDKFWNEIGGKPAYSIRSYEDSELQWDCPVVYPDTVGTMTDNGYECDSDGFVTAVTDKYSHHRSEVRLCPHCHNPLPKYFGKYPVKFISVAGIKSSGKTLFLYQLVSDREKYFGEVGLSVQNANSEADNYIKIDSVDSFVPLKTITETLHPPVTITTKIGNEFNTLVFFDIAGENCVDPQKMTKYGKFIKNSDGVIMLIDPVQFPEIAAGIGMESEKDVSAVLATMKDSFLTERLDATGKVNTPFAFVVSKSDYLVSELARNPKWRHSIVTDNVRAKNNKVNWGDILKVNRTVRDIINEYAPDSYLTSSIKDGFSNYVFLTVTSLGCDTKKVFANAYQRVKGQYIFDLAKLQEVSTLSIPLSDSQYYDLDNHISRYDLIPNPNKTKYIRYSTDGLLLDAEGLDIDLYKSHSVIQFEIDTVHEVVREMIYDEKDSSWKQGAMFGIAEQPRFVPQPKRVEEPLHWLLAKFGIAECADQ